MDPTTVQLKVYNKSLEGALLILRETATKVAEGDSREHILRCIKEDLENLTRDLEKYEKSLAS